MSPGATTFAVIPRVPYSRAKDFTAACKPALAAA